MITTLWIVANWKKVDQFPEGTGFCLGIESMLELVALVIWTIEKVLR